MHTVVRSFVGQIAYLLVPEPHLSPRVSRHVHSAEKDSLLLERVDVGWRAWAAAAAAVVVAAVPQQLGLDGGVILLVDDVIDAVAVDQKILLEEMRDF